MNIISKSRKITFFALCFIALVISIYLALRNGIEWMYMYFGSSFLIAGTIAYGLTPQKEMPRWLAFLEFAFAKSHPYFFDLFLINCGFVTGLLLGTFNGSRFWIIISFIEFDMLMCIIWYVVHKFYERNFWEHIRKLPQLEMAKRSN